MAELDAGEHISASEQASDISASEDLSLKSLQDWSSCDHRVRVATFQKRKLGLIKKAMEPSCGPPDARPLFVYY